MKRFIGIILLIVLSASCGSGDGRETISQEAMDEKREDIVEILYFFGRQSCISCGDIEVYSKDLIRDSFAVEVEEKKVGLRIIDLSKKENKAIGKKYEVVGSGLIISHWKDGVEEYEDMTAFSFNHLTTGEKEFKEEISKKIRELL